MIEAAVLERVQATLRAHDMLAGGERVLLAISGGPDSMTLLHVMVRLAASWRLTLRALHLDHGLRSESAAEAIQVQEWCAEHGVPCRVERIRVAARQAETGESVQEAARALRYAALREAADSDELWPSHIEAPVRIAVGHTADDQAETVLLRLLRGSGGVGLAGIPPVRDRVIRPLFDVQRDEVLAYCQAASLPYISDPSNESRMYLRNRVRHELIPHIEAEYNPQFRHSLRRLGEVLREDEAILQSVVEQALARPEVDAEFRSGWGRLRAAGVAALPLGVVRRILRHLYHHVTGNMGPSFERIEAARTLLRPGARGGARIELGGGAIAMRRGPWLEIVAAPTSDDASDR